VHDNMSKYELYFIQYHWCYVLVNITSSCRTFLEKLIVTLVVSEIPCFYRNQLFITTFTKSCHYNLSSVIHVVHRFMSYSSKNPFHNYPLTHTYSQVFFPMRFTDQHLVCVSYFLYYVYSFVRTLQNNLN
jgi:hypothetical protein